jgi:hypothetical protein
MIKYRVLAPNLNSEAVASTISVTGARLTELPDGLPHLRIEPRVGDGLQITTETIAAFGHASVEVGKLSIKLASGGGLSFNAQGELLATGLGAGTITGPVSSTDNAVVRWNGTTGEVIKNSLVAIDDDGRVTGAIIDSITNMVGADHIHFKIKASAPITKGQPVKITGFNSGENAYEAAPVSSASDISIGLAHDTLETGAFGAVMHGGLLEGINTSAYTVGTILYPTAAGGLTATQPTSGKYQAIAFVLRQHANNGAVLVEASEPQQVFATANVGNTAVLRDVTGGFAAGGITTATSGNTTIGNASTDTLTVTARLSSSLTWSDDNTYDIGGSGANRPRDLFVARNASIGGTLGVVGAMAGSSASFTSMLIDRSAFTTATSASHLELRSPEGAVTGDVVQLFHQQNRWYYAIRARAGGFHFTEGASDTKIPIYASQANLTGAVIGTDPGGAGVLRVGGDVRVGGTIYATDFVLTGGSGSGIGLELDSLDDVIIGQNSGGIDLAEGQVLRYDGSKWRNSVASGYSRGTVAFDGAAELVTSTTTPNQVVATLATATYRSAKYQVQVHSGSAYQVTELLVVHDGSTTYLTEYAAVFSAGVLATFSVDTAGGNMRLLVTPTNAVTTVKVAYTAVTI